MTSGLKRQTDLAWAAGLIDGEGSMGLYRTLVSLNSVRLSIAVSMVSPVTTKKLQAILGGRVYGPYHYSGVRQPVSRWVLAGSPGIERIIRLMRPYFVTKREDAGRLLRFIHWRKQQPGRWHKRDGNQLPSWAFAPKYRTLIKEEDDNE